MLWKNYLHLYVYLESRELQRKQRVPLTDQTDLALHGKDKTRWDNRLLFVLETGRQNIKKRKMDTMF